MFAKRITIHLFFFFLILFLFRFSLPPAWLIVREEQNITLTSILQIVLSSFLMRPTESLMLTCTMNSMHFLFFSGSFFALSLSLSFSFARLLAFFPSLFLFCLVVSMPLLLILSHLRHVTSLMRTIAKYNKFQIALQRIRLISIHHRIRRQHQSISTGCWLFSLLAYRTFSNVLSSQGRNGENESERFRI